MLQFLKNKGIHHQMANRNTGTINTEDKSMKKIIVIDYPYAEKCGSALLMF